MTKWILRGLAVGVGVLVCSIFIWGSLTVYRLREESFQDHKEHIIGQIVVTKDLMGLPAASACLQFVEAEVDTITDPQLQQQLRADLARLVDPKARHTPEGAMAELLRIHGEYWGYPRFKTDLDLDNYNRDKVTILLLATIQVLGDLNFLQLSAMTIHGEMQLTRVDSQLWHNRIKLQQIISLGRRAKPVQPKPAQPKQAVTA